MLVIADRLDKQESSVLVHRRQTLQVVSRHIYWYVLPRLFQVCVDLVEHFLKVTEAFTFDFAK